MTVQSNRLTIYLIRDGIKADQVVKDGTAGSPMGDVGTFYAVRSSAARPGWFTDFFGAGVACPVDLLVANAKAVLVTSATIGRKNRHFALVFGHGRFLLEEGVVEDRFGLKVVLNAIVPDSLRSIDKTTLGAIPKQSREQVSRTGPAASFGIDIEQDLVRAVTGRSKFPLLGTTLSGRDALYLTAKGGAGELAPLLRACMERYESKDYQAEFDWIDQIKEVRNSALANQLEALLTGKLQAQDFSKAWLAPPDIIDWADVKGFRYGPSRRKQLHDELDLAEFIAAFPGQRIDMDFLQRTTIELVSAKTDRAAGQWPVWRCLYVETDMSRQVYVLNDRRWYEIAPNFVAEVIRDYHAVPESALDAIAYAHNGEGAYNVALTAALGAHCLDADTIVHGGGHSRIEFCDVLTPDKKIIHVKRYSGSAQLSHLFSQGAVAGELFVQDAAFRSKLNAKLPAPFKLADPQVQPDAKEYEIVYGIVTDAPVLDVPFFSKVTLRNAARRLRAYGYKVSKKRIQVAKTGA